MPFVNPPSPAVAHARARVGAIVRHGCTDEQRDDARRALNAAKAEDYIKKVLDAAPPLSDEQRAKLAELLAPVRITAKKTRRTKAVKNA